MRAVERIKARPGVAAAVGACAAALVAALAFQHLGGLAPCVLCVWQRWPFVFGVVFGVAALAAPKALARWLAGAAGLVVIAGVVIAAYHVGVEQGWWPGPDTCAVPDPSATSVDALLKQLQATPVVRCDEVSWTFLGLSMAAWNVPFSLAVGALFLISADVRSVLLRRHGP
ncbi:MAG: disulfide bond formation protein B [Rhodobacteraceae bacterium]|nr:MAG: disulfide bond formation protein B [Paracoccaceae bacterium]